MLRRCPTPDRKLFANSFLPSCSATASRRIGNCLRIVSCRHAPPLLHAEQETFRKQFPAAMLRRCFMPNRKPFASSFLPPCSATASRRTGNLLRIVSRRYAPPLSHSGQETFRKQFPAAMLRRCPTPDRKLSANSFPPPCSATASRRIGNLSRIVSCRHAPPLSHAEQETFRE
jgi:hypothetical protein